LFSPRLSFANGERWTFYPIRPKKNASFLASELCARRLVVEYRVHDTPVVIAALHDAPHPLSGHPILALELHLDVVAGLVLRLAVALVSARKPATGMQQLNSANWMARDLRSSDSLGETNRINAGSKNDARRLGVTDGITKSASRRAE